MEIQLESDSDDAKDKSFTYPISLRANDEQTELSSELFLASEQCASEPEGSDSTVILGHDGGEAELTGGALDTALVESLAVRLPPPMLSESGQQPDQAEIEQAWIDYLSATRVAFSNQGTPVRTIEWRFCEDMTGYVVDDFFLSPFDLERRSNVGEEFTWSVKFLAGLAGTDAILEVVAADPTRRLIDHFGIYSGRDVTGRLRWEVDRVAFESIASKLSADIRDASDEQEACAGDD